MNIENRIAIVGMGGLFPEADNLDLFWQNILRKQVSIRPTPKEILDAEVFFRRLGRRFAHVSRPLRARGGIRKRCWLVHVGDAARRRGPFWHEAPDRGKARQGVDQQMNPRPYQKAILEILKTSFGFFKTALAAVKRGRREIIQLPTGCGKTFVFAMLIAEAVKAGKGIGDPI